MSEGLECTCVSSKLNRGMQVAVSLPHEPQWLYIPIYFCFGTVLSNGICCVHWKIPIRRSDRVNQTMILR
ncbi:unnamed protein product [Periconia digitata]|uniref:Uncharacterized protein n=1 Tax=Periconia digitata TaxID=1303443 RepID=A0A9W4XQL2_9PLEO|nr:unnamed protein product [Periconia digitata]